MKPYQKQLFLLGFCLLFETLSFWFLKKILFSNEKVQILEIILFSLFILLFFSFFLLFSLSFLGKNISRKTFILEEIGFFLPLFGIPFFFFPVNALTILGVLLFSGILIFCQRSIFHYGNLFLKFSFFKESKIAFRSFALALSILLSILLFFSPKTLGGKLVFPKFIFEILWPGLEKALQTQFPGFSGEMTVDEYLKKLIEERYQSLLKERNLSFYEKKLMEEKIKVIKKEELKKARENFSQIFGLKLKGEEKLKEVIYEAISKKINSFFSSYETWGKLGIIFVFFLLVRGGLSFVSFLFLIFSFLLFKILFWIKLFRIEKEMVEREKLTV